MPGLRPHPSRPRGASHLVVAGVGWLPLQQSDKKEPRGRLKEKLFQRGERLLERQALLPSSLGSCLPDRSRLCRGLAPLTSDSGNGLLDPQTGTVQGALPGHGSAAGPTASGCTEIPLCLMSGTHRLSPERAGSVRRWALERAPEHPHPVTLPRRPTQPRRSCTPQPPPPVT